MWYPESSDLDKLRAGHNGDYVEPNPDLRPADEKTFGCFAKADESDLRFVVGVRGHGALVIRVRADPETGRLNDAMTLSTFTEHEIADGRLR